MQPISLLVEETITGTEYEKQCVKGLAHIPVPEEESGKDPVDPVDYSQPEEEIPEVAKHSITLYHTNSKDYIKRQISELFRALCLKSSLTPTTSLHTIEPPQHRAIEVDHLVLYAMCYIIVF